MKETIIDFHVHLAKYESYTVNCDELLASAYLLEKNMNNIAKNTAIPRTFAVDG